MLHLPAEDTEYLKGLVEGTQSWAGWYRWFAMHAHVLAGLLPDNHMRRLKHEPHEFLPVLLTECGIDCTPPCAGLPGNSEKPVPSEWVLAICTVPSSLKTLSLLREAMELSVPGLAALRKLLPGVCRRGSQGELERLFYRLESRGFQASVFPAWELEDPQTDDVIDPIESEEYEVYSAVCKTNLFRFELSEITFDDFTAILSFSSTRGADRFHGSFKNRCLKHPEMLEDFECKNTVSVRLRKKFTTSGSYQFRSERRRKALCRDGNILYFSRVGFNKSRTAALVGLSYYGGPLYGQGYFLLLERSEEEWRMSDVHNAWVS